MKFKYKRRIIKHNIKLCEQYQRQIETAEGEDIMTLQNKIFKLNKEREALV